MAHRGPARAHAQVGTHSALIHAKGLVSLLLGLEVDGEPLLLHAPPKATSVVGGGVCVLQKGGMKQCRDQVFSTCKLMWAVMAVSLLVVFLGILMNTRVEGADDNVIRACVGPLGVLRIVRSTDRCHAWEKPI